MFERNREKFRSSLQLLTAFLWEHFGLPTKDIVEYGSGATGYFDAVLRPEQVQPWLQVEINPAARAENKRRNPNANVVEGSYNHIEYRHVPMIVGLSSFDTADDMPHAIDQVVQALSPGGFFFHVQDVRPGVYCAASHVKRKTGSFADVFYEYDNQVFGMEIAGVRRTLVNVFQEAIGEALHAQTSLEVLANDYVTLTESSVDAHHEIYFLNLHAASPGSLPVMRKRETTVLVTVARKKLLKKTK